jgi:hypothetical protein
MTESQIHTSTRRFPTGPLRRLLPTQVFRSLTASSRRRGEAEARTKISRRQLPRHARRSCSSSTPQYARS